VARECDDFQIIVFINQVEYKKTKKLQRHAHRNLTAQKYKGKIM
jgi:hypothetical protein